MSELFARKKLYIIDGYAQIYRSYFAMMNNPLRDGEGRNVSSVYGFFKALGKLIREYHPDYLAVAMDSHGPTFRHELYAPYKQNRQKAPDDLHAQVPVICHLLDAMGVPHLDKAGFEADDIIATLCDQAKAQGIDAVVFTGDKDLLQLVDEHVFALRPPKPKTTAYRLFGPKEVEEEFGVRPDQIGDYLCLLGDASDNVPGVDGIGPKGAVKLLSQYGTLDAVYASLGELAAGTRTKLEAARDHMGLTRKLIALRHDAQTVDSFESQCGTDNYRYDAVAREFDAMKLPSLVKEMQDLAGKKAPVVEVRPEGKRGVYVGTRDLALVESLFKQAAQESKVLAFDTETDSTDDMLANLLGFSFTWVEGKGWYVPVDGENREEVKHLLSAWLPRFGIVGQNCKYDVKVMRRFGVPAFPVVFDTMIAAWLLDSAGHIFNLDYLADRYLNYKTVHYDDAIPNGKTISDIPLEEAANYSGEDSDLALRLYHLFSAKLEEKGLARLMDEVEMPLLPILAGMEMQGIALDTGRIKLLASEFTSMMESTQAEIFRLAGKEFNLNSPSQLAQVLFSDLAIPPGAKTRTGFSTASDVLNERADEYPIVRQILNWRQISKLKNTYIDTLPGMINPVTGRVHPHFLQTGTETGRLACNNPNLQNIPVRSEEGRKIRSSFVAKEGCLFLSADYSQIELVVLAHLAQDRELMAAFREGEDIHKATAAKVFGEFPEFVTPDQRRIAKTINFGVVYGISAHSLAMDLHITHSQAKKFIDDYFATYKGVAAYIKQVQDDAARTGYVSTLLGHQREIKEITSANRTEQAKAQRIAVNTTVQGSAADIVKLAMLRVSEKMRQEGMHGALLLQIHDELIFEVPEEEKEAMEQLVRDAMEHACQLSIPLRVSIECARTWGEMH